MPERDLSPDLNRPRQGRHHDLEKALEVVNEAYFDGTVEASIYWGKWDEAVREAWACCYTSTRTVVVNPMLDLPSVPKYFLHGKIFHELLHLLLPEGAPVVGEDYHHTADFFHAEARYVHLTRAREWEKKHEHRLHAYAERRLAHGQA